MTTNLAILILICLLSGISVLIDDEKASRATMALAVCFVTVWLRWYGG